MMSHINAKKFEEGIKITWLGIMINLFLTVFKISAGISGKSQAMLSDGFHSLSDIIAGSLVLGSLKIAEKPIDETHPYGHGKAESIAAFIVAFLLIGLAVFLSIRAFYTLIKGITIIPGLLPLWAAIISIFAKELMYQHTKAIGKKLNSPAVMANALDHRADALSSVAALIGIGGARLGYPFLDPVAGFLVALFILKIGIQVYLSSAKELMDHSLPRDYQERIKFLVSEVAGVEKIDELKSRRIGRISSIDLAIQVDSHMSVEESHCVAQKIEGDLHNKLENVGNVMIHINPGKKDQDKEEKKLETISRILKNHYQEFIDFHNLHLIRKGDEEHLNLHLVISKGVTIDEAHNLCDHLEKDINNRFPLLEVIIHIEPEE